MEEKKYVICKTCGYIMEEGKLGEVCPACGVPAKMFEPYKSRVKENRRKILDLHIHPIILHFPQAAVVFALMLLLLLPLAPASLKQFVEISARFNTYLLPLCVLGGVLSGLLDGKIRFKTVKRPILKVKIMLSVLFLGLSLAAAILMGMTATLSGGAYWVLVLLLGGATGCAVTLGHIGSGLMDAAFPG